MNYNFKENWENVIMPLLLTPNIKKAIKKGIMGYIKNENHERGIRNKLKYNPNYYPRDYCRFDDNEVFEYEYEELPKLLLNSGVLLKDKKEPNPDDFSNEGEWEEAMEDYFNPEYQKYKDNVCSPYLKLWRDKQYKSYCLFGGCFWWNATFGLELARAVMPHVKWILRESEIHSTVTTKENNLVFDILYYEENDTDTFGGKKALNDVYNKIGWEEYNKLGYEIAKLRFSQESHEKIPDEVRHKLITDLEDIRENKYNQHVKF